MHTEETGVDRELETLLRQLDHEPPSITAEQMMARATAGRDRARALRRAAAVVLALAAAGGAYAIPGSPLPRWIERITGGPQATSSPPPPAAPTIATRQLSGVEISEPVTFVVIRTHGEGGYLRVALVGGDRLAARAPAGSARFTAEPDRLVIELLAADTIEVLVPRGARRIEVRANDRLLLRKQGPEVTTAGAAAAAGAPTPNATYIFPLEP